MFFDIKKFRHIVMEAGEQPQMVDPNQQMQQPAQLEVTQQPPQDPYTNLVTAAQQVSAEADASTNSVNMLKSQAEQLLQQSQIAGQKAAKAQETVNKSSQEAQQYQQQAQEVGQQAEQQEGMVNAKKQLADAVLSQIQQMQPQQPPVDQNQQQVPQM